MKPCPRKKRDQLARTKNYRIHIEVPYRSSITNPYGIVKQFINTLLIKDDCQLQFVKKLDQFWNSSEQTMKTKKKDKVVDNTGQGGSVTRSSSCDWEVSGSNLSWAPHVCISHLHSAPAAHKSSA